MVLVIHAALDLPFFLAAASMVGSLWEYRQRSTQCFLAPTRQGE